ncbi:hypothetical protein [Pusillimonas sp. ANT_WB101]|uniref:hypothetical protein n=1 Tax=Pusillimonas sp. ANT_WB101 TaxID=2597356 RepID=UPI0015D15A31|nr:hypothetical protein [Pusillimonas sp. ANT_WB101]NYT77541.1 hypothetical protein [Alcaligenaceae bacterium]
MLQNKPTEAPYRNWKVKQYVVPLSMRIVNERAQRDQPPMRSLHNGTDKDVKEEQ